MPRLQQKGLRALPSEEEDLLHNRKLLITIWNYDGKIVFVMCTAIAPFGYRSRGTQAMVWRGAYKGWALVI
jgi:hypothetical protein